MGPADSDSVMSFLLIDYKIFLYISVVGENAIFGDLKMLFFLKEMYGKFRYISRNFTHAFANFYTRKENI